MTARNVFLILSLLSGSSVLLVHAANESSAYLCIGERSVGFTYDRNEWVPGKLAYTTKFVLARSKRPAAAWNITNWGMKAPLVSCPQDIDSKGLLFCDVNGDFRFNMVTLRFVEANFQGYLIANSPKIVAPDVAEASTTSISIGSCTPL